ncbi:DUF5723 family protein [Algibacter mikhailovii]|uniref:Flagellar motor protein MotB n=1 Tax=Algibacter mikhailovii TaxID=425498 RepID=A0A918VAD9_9FLAO|nr:DUF5723 family protein [Algibacter mikhailovii]GGZ81132.1 flagellar motor protein MotB [Algibacter mikhailovii]
MKRIILLFLFLSTTFIARSQSYIGFLSDNYSGVHAVISNPAQIVGTPYKLDINLIGASALLGNDYYGVNVFDALKDDYDINLEANKYPLVDNRAGANVDVLGPAVMFNLNRNSSMALFTRGRSFGNVNNISGSTIEAIADSSTNDFSISEDDINGLGNGWLEFGVTYAHIILNKNQHVLKGGLTLKYLKGAGSAYAVGENVTLDYDSEGTDLGGGETTGSISSTGFLNYARFAEFDNENYNYDLPSGADGFGSDLGFVYEWRPNYLNIDLDIDSPKNKQSSYKLKIGLTVTDIGYVDYKNGIRQGFNITKENVSEEDFDNAEDLGSFLEANYTLTNSSRGYKIDLPTALHLNIDWMLKSKLFLNLNTDYSLMSKDRRTANFISNIVSLTPRYETKSFSFYLPLSVIDNSGFRMGAGIRTGPFYIGSGSIISALTSSNNKEADIYAGFKIGVFDKDKSDKDGDGIIDKEDDCPNVAGPVENNGCPWGDKDGDAVLDNVDACPDEFGPEENNGCPWEDTDGDGVPDKDDKCKFDVGTVANMGCPEAEVTEAVQKELNDYARVILFNFGNAEIKAESTQTLLEIVKILNEYPSAKFTIEGHTDSIGSYEVNQNVSDERAKAVKAFLVDNGVDSSRLTAIGYGERKPIATNMYKAGRAKNRRVEINLVK